MTDEPNQIDPLHETPELLTGQLNQLVESFLRLESPSVELGFVPPEFKAVAEYKPDCTQWLWYFNSDWQLQYVDSALPKGTRLEVLGIFHSTDGSIVAGRLDGSKNEYYHLYFSDLPLGDYTFDVMHRDSLPEATTHRRLPKGIKHSILDYTFREE